MPGRDPVTRWAEGVEQSYSGRTRGMRTHDNSAKTTGEKFLSCWWISYYMKNYSLSISGDDDRARAILSLISRRPGAEVFPDQWNAQVRAETGDYLKTCSISP